MSRLRIAVIATVIAALGVLPAVARATVTSSQINTWTSSQPGTPANNPYLISFDNPPKPTRLDVAGVAPGSSDGDMVDIVCYFGSPGAAPPAKLKTNVPVTGGAFDTGAVLLRPIAGHACRLRAIPAGAEGSSDFVDAFAGPQVAVSEAALPSNMIPGGTQNPGKPYDYYFNDVTFTGWAAWQAVGTSGCGPDAAPIDQAFNVGNFAIDCAGSLMGDDLGAWGGRSEVQVDGRNAYDAASAQPLFPRTSGDNGSEDLSGFPTLTAAVDWDPSTGLASSRSQESMVACVGPDPYKPKSIAQCPGFEDTGVTLERDLSTSDGGRVVRMTDTWSSTDGNPHALDLLYDDFVGLTCSSATRGYSFPGQGGFNAYVAGDPVPGPASAPGTIFAHTNVSAADGNPNEAFGAITFSNAPTGFHVTRTIPPGPPSCDPQPPAPPSNEVEERQLLSIPAGGSASLSYVYSVGYSLADVSGNALTGQDVFQPPTVAIASPSNGATVSTPAVTVSGTANAGSGLKSLVVAGQQVNVASDGTWSAQVALSPGSNTITALATSDSGGTAQAQVSVVYQPPAAGSPPPADQPPVRCQVPRIKGMKLAKAERALRHAHCRVGKVKHVKSRKLGRGRVMSTAPHAGRRLAAGTKVELFVSKGP